MSGPLANVLDALAMLAIASMIMWGPIFGFAYATRRFGASVRTYVNAYFAVCLLTLAAFVVFAFIFS